MRVTIPTAALCGILLAAAPADAAVIVQYTNDDLQGPLVKFDRTLGTLDRVTLSIDVTRFHDWIVIPRAGVTSDTITWSIDTGYAVRVFGQPPASFSQASIFPLRGSGVTVVDLTDFRPNPTGPNPVEPNLFLTSYASGTVDLEPTVFIGSGRDLFYIQGEDLGWNSPVGTTISSAAGSAVFRAVGRCRGDDGLEDLCGSTPFAVTYFYTPAVPEPGTWAMMLLGFGAVGCVMRRRPRLAFKPCAATPRTSAR